MVWVDSTNVPSAIYGQFINPSGSEAGTAFILRSNANAQQVGAIAFDGNNFLVVWESNGASTNLTATVQGQFVTSAGMLLGEPISISSGSGRARFPGVAFDGSNHLVVWTEQVSRTNLWYVQGRFISKQGAALAPFAISEHPACAPYPLGVAFGLTNHLVVWSGETGPFGPLTNQFYPMLHARLLPPANSVSSLSNHEFQLTWGKGGQLSPAIAFDGTNFFVTWYDNWLSEPDRPLPRVQARLVSCSGELLGPLFHSGFGWWDTFSPSLAFGAGKYFVVWNVASRYSYPDYPRSSSGFFSEVLITPPMLRNFSRGTNGDANGYGFQVSSNLIDWTLTPANDHLAYLTRPGRVDLLVSNAVVGGRQYFRAVEPHFGCINNLRKIEEAKLHWALDFDKGATALPSDSDLYGPGKYIHTKPSCPLGGTYSPQDVDAEAMCSFGAAAGHTL